MKKSVKTNMFAGILGLLMLTVLGGCGDDNTSTKTIPTPPATTYKYFAYAANIFSDNITAYAVDTTTGALTEIAGSPFDAEAVASAVTVDPSGKFAYVANYATASNSVSAYTIDAATGALTETQGSPFSAGTNPNAITVDPTGKFVYATNELSNNVSAYTIGASTGALTEIAGSPFDAGTDPRSIVTVKIEQ
jgi:6-phosphogluconolactonase (cycloisomerase 2 family)